MNSRRAFVALTGALLFCSGLANGDAISNSLWIGNNDGPHPAGLNTDRSGSTLRTLDMTWAAGFAADVTQGLLYVSAVDGSGPAIETRDLNTLALLHSAPIFCCGSDIAFDGTRLWTVGGSATDAELFTIDPVTGAEGGTQYSLVGIPNAPYSLAWDGSGFWITQFNVSGSAVIRYSATGVPTGQSFVPFPNSVPGGVAFDTTDGTLWIGTWGEVDHFTTTGVKLGSFALGTGRFGAGLSFEGAAVPEPSTATLILVAGGMAAICRCRRRTVKASEPRES